MSSFGDDVRKIEFGEPHTHTTYNRPVEDLIVALDERLGEVEDGATMNRDDAVVDALLGDKVDKVDGKGLSTNDYTDSDKDKVDSMVEHFRGTFGTQAELASIPTPVSGNYADVRVGGELKRYIYDATTGTWILPEAGGEDVDAAGVKQLYESNPDTNAFGDADKSKLGGIATGATKNATDAQLRARSTHTGTQNVSTITGLSDAATTPIATIRSGITKGDVGLGNLENFPITGSVSDTSEQKLATAGAVKKAYDRNPTFNEVTSKPATATRWPTFDEVTSKPATATRWPSYGEVTGKPATFPPSTHSHDWGQVTGKPIVQTTGTSTTDLMSQAAVTDAISDIGGSGEIDFTTLVNNATELTPEPGKSYWLNRSTSVLLVTTLSCTHRPNKIRSWHMIVSKKTGAGDNFIPRFALTGLSQSYVAWSGGGEYPPKVSGVSHVMIAFTQIDQSVRAMVVDGW